MFKIMIKFVVILVFLVGVVMMVSVVDYKLCVIVNFNENDEDYDGLIVFKNYVEVVFNGVIEVELFIGI